MQLATPDIKWQDRFFLQSDLVSPLLKVVERIPGARIELYEDEAFSRPRDESDIKPSYYVSLSGQVTLEAPEGPDHQILLGKLSWLMDNRVKIWEGLVEPL